VYLGYNGPNTNVTKSSYNTYKKNNVKHLTIEKRLTLLFIGYIIVKPINAAKIHIFFNLAFLKNLISWVLTTEKLPIKQSLAVGLTYTFL